MKAEKGRGYACSIFHLPAYDSTYEEQLKQSADDVARFGYIFSSVATLRGLTMTGKHGRACSTISNETINPPRIRSSALRASHLVNPGHRTSLSWRYCLLRKLRSQHRQPHPAQTPAGGNKWQSVLEIIFCTKAYAQKKQL